MQLYKYIKLYKNINYFPTANKSSTNLGSDVTCNGQERCCLQMRDPLLLSIDLRSDEGCRRRDLMDARSDGEEGSVERSRGKFR